MLFELKKCIVKKHIIFGILFFSIWGLFLPLLFTYGYWWVNLNTVYENKSDVINQIENDSLSGLSLKEIVSLEQTEYEALHKSPIPQFFKELLFESASQKAGEINIARSYYSCGFSTSYIKKLQEAERTRSLISVQTKLLQNHNIRLEKQLSMLENVGEPQMEFTRFMQYYENFGNVAMLVIVTFLLLVFSNTGSLEYSSNMYLVLYSSPIKKMKVFFDKMISVIVVGSGAVSLLSLCHFTIFFGTGYGKNLTADLNSLSLDFTYCPYSINVLTYFALKFIFEQATIVVLAAMIVFISMKWKSSVITVAITGTITLGGYSLAIIGFDSNIFVRYSLAGGISPHLLFKDFYAAELYGNVILYPLIYAVWLCLLLSVFIWRSSDTITDMIKGRQVE